jgi:hypothetical protein
MDTEQQVQPDTDGVAAPGEEGRPTEDPVHAGGDDAGQADTHGHGDAGEEEAMPEEEAGAGGDEQANAVEEAAAADAPVEQIDPEAGCVPEALNSGAYAFRICVCLRLRVRVECVYARKRTNLSGCVPAVCYL